MCLHCWQKKEKKKTSMKNANTNTEGCKSERGKQSRGVVLMQDLKMCGGWFERTYSIVTLARERRESKESDGARRGMKRNRIDLLSAIPWKKTTTNKQTDDQGHKMYGRQCIHANGITSKSARLRSLVSYTLLIKCVPALISVICFCNQFQGELLSRGFHFSCTVCFHFAVALPCCFVSYRANAKAKTNVELCLQWLN